MSDRRSEEEVFELLRLGVETLRQIDRRLRSIEKALLEDAPPQLSYVAIGFESTTKGETMSTGSTLPAAPAPGPITLITAGQTAKAILFYFDQNGIPMPSTFTPPAAAFSVDDTTGAVVKVVDNGDDTATVTDVADGTAKLSVALTSAEGLAITASQVIAVSNTAPPPPAPVLTTVQIGFE